MNIKNTKGHSGIIAENKLSYVVEVVALKSKQWNGQGIITNEPKNYGFHATLVRKLYSNI